MKGLREIMRYTFRYRGLSFLVILCNFLFVVFELLSLALFIPFLQVIFENGEQTEVLSSPVYDGTFTGIFSYFSEWYQYEMQVMSNDNPMGALLFVCISVAIKNDTNEK